MTFTRKAHHRNLSNGKIVPVKESKSLSKSFLSKASNVILFPGRKENIISNVAKNPLEELSNADVSSEIISLLKNGQDPERLEALRTEWARRKE